ncbi:MAG: hypothetical protein QX197_10030 [Methylococcaceae bacterium]
MKNEANQDKAIKQAFAAGRDAIIKSLGKDFTQEQALDVALLMVHALVTENETLNRSMSQHNTKVFCTQLLKLVAMTQTNTESNSNCGRFM